MFKWLRILVYLKRIAIALERSNVLAEQRIALDHPQWARDKGILSRKKTSNIQFSRATAEAINERYRQNHPELDSFNE